MKWNARWFFGILTLCVSLEAVAAERKQSPRKRVDVERRVFAQGDRWLKLEWVADSAIHFEFGRGQAPDVNSEIYRSPLFARATIAGAPTFRQINSNSFSTKEMRIDVNGTCFDVTDLLSGQRWSKLCMDYPNSREFKTLKVQTNGVRNVYGLGQIFAEPGSTEVDRNGKVIETHGDYGNMMAAYAGGAVGETMFPVAYGLGSGDNAFLFALDNVYKQRWDLTSSQWNISMFGDNTRGFVVTGGNPLELRKKFMALSGRPPVPPKKLFGFWMSEYGYDDWREVDDRLSGMRRDRFPIDGFFLDLQWFGNVTASSDYTAMGKLTFDESKFPDPAQRMAAYKKQGIGFIPIEESYIGRALPEHKFMGDRGYLAHECKHPTKPSYLTGATTGNASEWWGRGGMIDWSNREGGAFWHDSKRQKLIDMGITGHWLDLGEPEMFDKNSCYAGAIEPGLVHHQDIHNIYSLLWAENVWEGYQRKKVTQRPFTMLRSGNIGMQRYGAGMWSGDIGGNLESLSAHIGSHVNMSWSGIDYYSSDIGGFHRNRANGQALGDIETQENFTQWFANATWLDVPLRTHVLNLDNDRQTAPNRIGHIESNLHNLRQRYALTPYYYSLAWYAHTEGIPLMMPMSMGFPNDLKLRNVGDEQMLGHLVIATASEKGIYQRDVRLPAGSWYDMRDGTYIKGANDGTLLKGVPLYRNGMFQLPVYAPAGGLVPKMRVDQNTTGVDTKRVRRNEDGMDLDAFVGADGKTYAFSLFEDDGSTIAYQQGSVRRIRFEQRTNQNETEIKILPASGEFAGAATQRSWHINVFAPTGWGVNSVRYGGAVISVCGPNTDDDSLCYRTEGVAGTVEVLLPTKDVRNNQRIEVQWVTNQKVRSAVHFVCQDYESAPRHASMFVAGSDPRLGVWDLNHAIPMTTNNYLRGVWTAYVPDLPPSTQFEWKCVKIPPQTSGRSVEWQPGPNNKFTTSAGGFSGVTRGSFGQKVGH